jgi:serine/threonine protein kinase
MKFAPGTRLGPYEILAPLGAGGMGEVFRARDPRLGREVAVKVLPPAFSSDPERLHRFEQEARATSVLNHPNIVVIFDVGTEEGAPYVVSELLEGETLRERMVSGALPLSRVIDYALQVAKGLAAAHAKNIVHRDIKPENLFLTRDGLVKILDFGLAKLVRPEAADDLLSQAATVALQTQEGKMLGTMGYMSPEQLRGQPTDYRSDLFSFGVVLYEMLSGERPFQRDSTADTMSAILKEDPRELSRPDRAIPPALERIIQHCLEKRPEDRFQSTRDVAYAIESLSALGDAEPEDRAGTAAKKKSATRASKTQRVPALSIPTFRQLTFRRGTIFSARLAPDGHTIVYSAAWDGEPVEIFSTRSGFPESRSLGFRNAHLYGISSSGELAVSLDSRFVSHRQFVGTLARVPLEGAAPRALLEGVSEADWSPDGRSLAIVRQAEGRARLEYPAGKVLAETSGWISHARIAPKGKLIAFLDHAIFGDDRGAVAVVDLEGNKRTLSDGWAGEQGLAWSAGASEVWFTAAESGLARALHAVSLAGRPRLVTRMAGGIILHDIASDGRMLIVRDVERSEIMARLDGEPRERNLSWLDLSVAVDLSDDGKALLFMEQGVAVGSAYAACLRRTDGSPPVRLGEGAAHGLSPDGRWALAILYGPEHQLVLLPTGAGELRPLPREGIEEYVAARWIPDGRRIVFVGKRHGESARCYVQGIEGEGPRAITEDEVAIRGLPVSPDSRFIACARSDRRTVLYPLEGGEPRPVPGVPPGEVLIRWSDDGGSLFTYLPGELPARVHRVRLDSGQREPWMQISPSDPAGVASIGQIRLTPDGRSCVYSFKRTLSELYLVEGQS